MKNSIIILFFVALIANTFSRSLVLADYLVNMKAYQEMCINKKKPSMHCNGKCQMMKKLKKQEGETGTATEVPKYNQPELVLSTKTYFPRLEYIKSINSSNYPEFATALSNSYTGSIFQPPGA